MPVDKKELRDIYIMFLEEDIILEISKRFNIDNREAMEKYYKSKLCKQINGEGYGIEYMDYKYLVDDLVENEGELFD
ncbi:MAG: hypothetical protein ACRCUS_09065 [Anaerovoracaceae bacterium]